MKKIYAFLSFIFFTCAQSIQCQSNFEDFFEAQKSIGKEHVLVHLNKEIFTTAETLWFTAYLQSQATEKVLDTSANLHVGLYDYQGKLINQSVHYIENGVASGSLLLEQPPGTYFLKMQTNWMRNFPDSKPFVKQIQIIHYQTPTRAPQKTDKVVYRDINTLTQSPEIEMIVNTKASKDLIISFQKLKSKHTEDIEYFLAFHNNKAIELTKLEIKGKTKVLKISKDQLTEGIHTVLLLDKNKKVLQERLIFHKNFYKLDRPFQIEAENKKTDSITLSIKEKNTDSTVTNLSISIVPLESKAIEKLASLQTQDTFKDIWIPEEKDLFVPTNRVSLAVLNENLAFAKNTLDWNTLGTKSKERLYNKERGFEIEGIVKKWDGGFTGKVSFYQRKAGQFETTKIDKDGSFIFRNSYLENGENINFTVLRNNRSISKPEITFTVRPKNITDSIPEKFLQNYEIMMSDTLNVNPIIEEPEITTASGIKLDEVEIRGSTRREVFKRNKKLAESSFHESIKITTEIIKKSPTLSSFIRKLGFATRIKPSNGRFIVLARNPVKASPSIIVDDFLETEGIIDVPLASIDEVYYEVVNIYGDVTSVIYIYRKFGAPVGLEKEGVVSYPVDIGFETPQSYFNENISTQFDSLSKKYKSVYWNGNINFDTDSNVEMTFPSYGLDGVKVILQGINEDGEFFSMEKEVFFE